MNVCIAFTLYSYVKVYLLPDKSKAGKRKTRVKKHTMNPIFDEVLKYSLPLEELNNRTLWLSVWHSDMFGRNNFLGEVRLPLENMIFDDPSPKFYPLQERVSFFVVGRNGRQPLEFARPIIFARYRQNLWKICVSATKAKSSSA